MSHPTERLSAALDGRYRIERLLGQGGMASVYLAEDLKHDRKVAIKVLKPELAAVLGADRFVQEIKTTAALSHPHILPLFDSGEASGFLYYVMPYIEGETIRDRLNREAQFAVEDAVRVTREVADALDYAHRQGVIHRDIKPENILLHDGRAMVMDFGIALAVSAAAGGRMTETGLSLGTPHYMSPEQATAERDITARSDVYSLATVLFEMLAGQPPHLGGTAQQIIMKIITEQAQSVTALRKSVPPNVAAAVAKALEKLPADRFDTARGFADALANATFSTQTLAMGGLPTLQQAKRLRTEVAVLAAAAVLLAGAAVWGWIREVPRVVSRYRATFAQEQQPTFDGFMNVAWAPDESWFVYVGSGTGGSGSQLWRKQRDQLDATPIVGTTGATAVTVSPDGRRIAFTVGSKLQAVAAGGGASTPLADSAWSGLPPVWLEDGSIAYMDSRARLVRAGAIQDTVTVLFEPDAGAIGAIPLAELPSGRGILFLQCNLNCTPMSDLWVLDRRSGDARQLYPEVSWAAYRDGLLLFAGRDGTVSGVPFDLGKLAPEGAPVALLGGVRLNLVANIALTPRGSAAYLTGAATGVVRSELTWIDRTGVSAPMDSGWTFEAGSNPGLALSPDGKRVALGIRTDGNSDIWIKELGGPVSRITRDIFNDTRARWTRDGRSVTFTSNRGGVYAMFVRRADGTGSDSLAFSFGQSIYDASTSPDGRWEIFRVGSGANSTDIYVRELGVDSLPRALLAEPHDETSPMLSPDGRWLAYVSNETGRREVFVRPFPDVNSGKWKISDGGGVSPLWAHSGREIFFVDESKAMISQELTPGATFQRGVQRKLFTLSARYVRSTIYTDFDITADDRRFLVSQLVQESVSSAAPVLMIVENWMDEVRQRLRER